MNPTTNLYRLFCLALLLIGGNLLYAQKTEITGVVKDSITHEPIISVIIKAFENQNIIAFCTTNNKGEYKLSVESQSDSLTLNYEHIAYTTKTRKLPNKSQVQHIDLTEKQVSIREVSVKAPEIIVKKDTLSFNVRSFTTESDRNMEDVIKKLPGVNVADDGKISFQGKAISSFQIENMSMLGGRYTLATRNVQPKDVNRVEVIENYQEIKQNQGDPSELVAMNLKLNNEAKNRLLGSAELGAGYRDNEALYHAALTGMMFNKKWQFMAIAKANNWGTPLSGEVRDHFGEYYGYNIADALVSTSLTSYPPVGYERHHRKEDLMTTANSIVKLANDNQITVNADYIRRNDEYAYETTSNYFLGNSNVIINEKQHSDFLLNSLRTKVNIRHNSNKLYLNNTTTLEMKGYDNNFDLTSNGNTIGQNVDYQFSGLTNRTRLLVRKDKKSYSVNSTINYSNLPNYRLGFSNVPNVQGAYSQTAGGNTFSSVLNTNFGYQLGKLSQLGIGLSVRTDYDKIVTTLEKGDSTILNRNDGYKITTTITPSYTLIAPDRRRYSVNASMPINIININYRNRLDKENDFTMNRPFFNPSLNGMYQLTPYSKYSISGGYSTHIGDIANFVINPIQNTYKSQSSRSGILAQRQSLSSNLTYEYSNPIMFLFATGSISHGNTWRNLLNSQQITSGSSIVDINTTAVADKNSSKNTSVSGSVSKDIRSIGTSISVRSSYGIATGQQIRQGIKTSIEGNSFSVSPSVKTVIAKKVELNYSMNYSRNTQSSINFSNVYRNQSHRLNLSYNPLKSLVIFSSFEFARFELAQASFKNTQFLDGGVRYKYKKTELELKLNNLLNTKTYSYSVLSDLDRYTYTYYLNPREIVALCKFNL